MWNSALYKKIITAFTKWSLSQKCMKQRVAATLSNYRKPTCSNEDPVQAKINNLFKKQALFTATVSSTQKAPENRDQLRTQIRERYPVSGYLVQPSELAVCF